MDSLKIERALFSVSDKTGLTEFAQGLAAAGVEIYASGGTRRHLEAAGVTVREVAAYTGFPEMMDGRIKTLHPKIHGGILCRRDNPADMLAIAEQGIVPFELVVVNLYPFQETVEREGVTIEEAIEQIDIGGPTLIRAAAKNYTFVTVATNASQYKQILEQIEKAGVTTFPLRSRLAKAAFMQTEVYDKAIAAFFVKQELLRKSQFAASAPEKPPVIVTREEADYLLAEIKNKFPADIELVLKLERRLRYGENPHQYAALYSLPDAPPSAIVRGEKLHGKDLSYNNFLDLDSALAVARSLPTPGVAVLKHNNPCGAATATTLGDAMRLAWEGDPVSAFGSVLGFNVPVDAAASEFLAEPERFVEAIIAPDFTPQALEILTTRPKWKANVRLLKVGQIEPGRGGHEFRQVSGGMLCQNTDDLPDDETEWKIVTEAKPSESQQADLRFAWAVCRHVKSNAIVLARDQALVGVGAGQMSRVDSVEIAIRKAGERARGSALASDAFFPFADSIEHAAKAGVAAIIQPGGSRRDDEVIAACNRHALPMIFTGRRHFRH